MLIGEIAKKAGLSRDTIRFYEKQGLIETDRSYSKWNNYKNYNENTLDKLLLIKKTKGFGFTLKEIGEILDLFEMKKASCSTISTKVVGKLEEIDRKIKELQDVKKLIADNMAIAKKTCTSISENTNCQALSTSYDLE